MNAEDYSLGYSDGYKDAHDQGIEAGYNKAYWEMFTWQQRFHADDCECRPCRAVRHVLEAAKKQRRKR